MNNKINACLKVESSNFVTESLLTFWSDLINSRISILKITPKEFKIIQANQNICC